MATTRVSKAEWTEEKDGLEVGREQYKTTIPLAEAMGLEGGDELTWEVDSANAFRVVVDEG